MAQEEKCPPPPCKISPSGRASCEAAADWVIEGELGSVTDEWEQTPYQYGTPRGIRWKASTVALFKARGIKLASDAIFKGTITPQQFGATMIISASPCWQAQTKIDHAAIGNVVRFYGSDKTGPYPAEVSAGYFAYETVGKSGEQK